MSRLSLFIKAIQELGPKQLGLYACYQLGLRSGFYHRVTVEKKAREISHVAEVEFHPVINLPNKDEVIALLGEDGLTLLLAEANKIVAGRVRSFGGDPVLLQLTISVPLKHWTMYRSEGDEVWAFSDDTIGKQDIKKDPKFIWESARFSWAFTLARAYYVSRDEHYAEAFWSYTEKFLNANPAYLGPHWVSAQEVALRLISLVFATQIFSTSKHASNELIKQLKRAIAEHAHRIPPTLVYSRAQNNNHLLSEAAGLLTAGYAIPNHPSANHWRNLGWRWFNQGILSQISTDGVYIQQSSNYHRLMIQLALWVNAMLVYRAEIGTSQENKPREYQTIDHNRANSLAGTSHPNVFPPKTRQKLASATRWLLDLLDNENGRVPNLGPNDGAYILPLTICPFYDYRPALGTAAMAFLYERPLNQGPWDEMNLWLLGRNVEGKKWKKDTTNKKLAPDQQAPKTPLVLQNTASNSWGYLRAAHFTNRPGHADQLHFDLWWRGLNVALDAGTFSYNAHPPWDNALTTTKVHNTISINGSDQMIWAGRFLYLDWAQAHLIRHKSAKNDLFECLVAQHDGYRHMGVIHQEARSTLKTGNWRIEDYLVPLKSQKKLRRNSVTACLQWLIPDWPWEIEAAEDQSSFTIRLQSSSGPIRIKISTTSPNNLDVQIIRAGELIYGVGSISPTWGWYSPTYDVRNPSLFVRASTISPLPIKLISEWIFPDD